MYYYYYYYYYSFFLSLKKESLVYSIERARGLWERKGVPLHTNPTFSRYPNAIYREGNGPKENLVPYP
jgi:hypothetical protein